MKAKFKSFISLLLAAALVITLIPGGMARAADVTTSFFSPDDSMLRSTVLFKLDSGTKPKRDNVPVVTSGNYSVNGSYFKVAGSTLSAEVRQLNENPTTGNWTQDSSKVTPGVINEDTTSPDNRFKASLTLYPGMNMITFSGQQGSMTRSEVFYVLFDQVAYIESLQILGGSSPINLNEGTQVVVPLERITMRGKVQNSTSVTVSLNGAEDRSTSLLADGSFFSPELKLLPGLNKLKFKIKNGSDSIVIDHELYYYDETNPFTSLGLKDTDTDMDLLNDKPTWTATTTPTLTGQVLIPDNGKEFKVDGKIIVDPNETGSGQEATVISEKVIQGTSGVVPTYRVVTFELPNMAFKQTNGVPDSPTQNHELRLTYGTTVNRGKTFSFTYQPGQTVITGLYYLQGYQSASDRGAKKALNGAEVNGSSFEIEVDTSSVPTTALEAKYLPTGVAAINLELIETLSNTKFVYRVTNFQNGTQNVRFQYKDASAYKDVKISFVSKNYIYVSNLQDGQTYTMNSSESKTIIVKGEYIGFDLNNSFFGAEVFVNGVTPASGSGFKSTVVSGKGKFSLSLGVSAATGPLVFGENRIVFTGTGKDEKGIGREIRKELRIYVVDENVSTVSNFIPASSNNRIELPTGQFSAEDPNIAKMFNLTTDFIYNDNKYTTSLKQHDLVARGSGAAQLVISQGTKQVFTLPIPSDSNSAQGTGNFVYDGKTYVYEFAGSQKDFVLRVRDLLSENPGSYFYTLDLINDTGAKTSQKIEIVREVSAYRLLAPQPSVDDKYVVTRNYIHFDIEAEGATSVKFGKEEALKRPDLGKDRFTYDYVGLKQDKSTTIKFTIEQTGGKINGQVDVYYTGTVAVDAAYMAPKVAAKYSVFNKSLDLSLPKGTVLESTTLNGITKYYPDTKLMFGIADPTDGVVERRNDYGNLIGFPGIGLTTAETNLKTWSIPDEYLLRFNSQESVRNFTPVSNVYWISGGLGERGNQGQSDYIPPTNGLAPYSVSGLFGDPAMSSERIVTPSQRGELTLAYNKNVVEDAGTTISVFHYGADRQWKNIGGDVDAKKHTVTVPFDDFGYYKVVKLSRSYTDVTNHGWARNILNGMYSKGLMNNLRFDQFGTDDQTTRGEFATLLVKGLQLPLNSGGKQTFVDLVPGAQSSTWDYSHIETAARAGIVSGLTDGVFAPDQPINREQAAVMITRALKLKTDANGDKLKAKAAKAFLDSTKADSYSLPSIMAVNSAKIMSGAAVTVPGQKQASFNFNPKANLTRAEAAKIAVALLQKSTSIFPKNFS
ncbi:S-layer homology domain-containing protein [Saccharibacillus qingshengii]|uniref:S-layer homology domain-containing protein n=1 Tax=Saccharibacillus qingshengii TaxID=1763540 RepID=UPI001554366E|nr:S-layer homology domain-containing protein [Saccharibacillus qingshengii]